MLSCAAAKSFSCNKFTWNCGIWLCFSRGLYSWRLEEVLDSRGEPMQMWSGLLFEVNLYGFSKESRKIGKMKPFATARGNFTRLEISIKKLFGTALFIFGETRKNVLFHFPWIVTFISFRVKSRMQKKSNERVQVMGGLFRHFCLCIVYTWDWVDRECLIYQHLAWNFLTWGHFPSAHAYDDLHLEM